MRRVIIALSGELVMLCYVGIRKFPLALILGLHTLIFLSLLFKCSYILRAIL